MLSILLVAGHASSEGKKPSVPGTNERERGWVIPGYDAVSAPVEVAASLRDAGYKKRKKLKRLDVAATDLFYSPSTRILYVTVGSDSARYASTLLEVDPKTRKVLHETPLSGNPNRLSVTDADYTAWVILDDSRAARVDLLAHRVVTEFTPTLDTTSDAIRPITIAAIPNHPGTVALSFVFRDHSGDLATALYEEGVRRPALIDGFSATQLIVAGDMIWANNTIYNFQYSILRRLAIRPEGLVWDGRPDAYAGKFDVSLEDGRFYSTSGRIVDAETRLQVGWIPTDDYKVVGHAVDTAAGKIYFAFNYDFTLILVYDLDTGRPEGFVDGSVYAEYPHIRQMVQCGEAGIVTIDDDLTFYPPKVVRTFRPYERPAPSPENGQVRVIPLPNSYIAYDDVRRKIYATVSPGNPGIGNSIVEIDPYQGTVGRDALLGSAPGILTLSDDRSQVYVAMWGSYQVKRVRTSDFSTERAINLSRGPYGENQDPLQTNAKEILPLPGSQDAIAVLYNWQPWVFEQFSEGIAVYDDDVRRPSYTGYGGTVPDSLELDDDGVTIYGLTNQSTRNEFLRCATGPGGVYGLVSLGTVDTGFFDQLHIAGSRCYTDGGSVIDVATGMRVGRLDFDYENFTSYLTVPDMPRGLVYQLTANDNGFKITSYDIVTFRRVGSVQLPPHLSYYVESLLVWDDGRELAFTAGDSIYLVPASLLQP